MRGLVVLGALLASGLSFTIPLGGCVMPTTSGPDAGNGGKLTLDSGIPSTNPTGTGCGSDPTTGVTLCTGTTECPGLAVDPSTFPGCGFYISGTALYLECVCSGYLCPMGAPTSCSAALAVLQSMNEGTVCGQISSNGCTLIPTQMGGTAGTGGTSGTGGTAGNGPVDAGPCDMTCESMCAGEPDCIQMCGC